MISSIKNFFRKKDKESNERYSIIKVVKEFDIEEFNHWFKNDFDGYDGRKGASGIFLRCDKLSMNWIEIYLESIGQDTSYDNVQKYYEIVRKDWIGKLNK